MCCTHGVKRLRSPRGPRPIAAPAPIAAPLHQSKRITVAEALKHKYMDSLHCPDDEPVAESEFNFDFDRHELTTTVCVHATSLTPPRPHRAQMRCHPKQQETWGYPRHDTARLPHCRKRVAVA